MKVIFFLFSFAFSIVLSAQTNFDKFHFFELKVYEYTTTAQEKVIDEFLSQSFLPFLHKNGRSKVGVFSNYGNDTSVVKRVYVLIPHKTLSEIPVLQKEFFLDKEYMAKGASYIDASSSQPAFNRVTTYILEGFRFAPFLMLPNLKSGNDDRVYELRSYESASEKKYWKKVEMFNEGGEIDLFARLNFNAVFYAEVVSGPTMPNLMYMTSFENMEDRNAHWKAFSNDPKWKELLSMKEDEKTESKNVNLFLRAKAYSDF
jgi:hypothetical protein